MLDRFFIEYIKLGWKTMLSKYFFDQMVLRTGCGFLSRNYGNKKFKLESYNEIFPYNL